MNEILIFLISLISLLSECLKKYCNSKDIWDLDTELNKDKYFYDELIKSNQEQNLNYFKKLSDWIIKNNKVILKYDEMIDLFYLIDFQKKKPLKVENLSIYCLKCNYHHLYIEVFFKFFKKDKLAPKLNVNFLPLKKISKKNLRLEIKNCEISGISK